MENGGVTLGIDFGTSHTVAVVRWPDGRARPLLFDGTPLLASAVYADPAGGLLVGRDAVHSGRTRPGGYEPHPKQRIDDRSVLLANRDIAVEELIAAVLARVAAEAARTLSGRPARIVLTYPAEWGAQRRAVLVAAARRAGLTWPGSGDPVLVPEPVAAAAYFLALHGGQLPPGACVVVYDFGAGTFDASVLRRTPAGFEVLASEGRADVGGLDVDSAIVDSIGRTYAGHPEWRRLSDPVDDIGRRARFTLWQDVRGAKEMLSRTASTMVHVPLLERDVPVSREELDRLATPIIERTVQTTSAALQASGVQPAQVAGVFLVGGSSRLALVATALHRALGVAPTVTEQPELVVAEGSLHAVQPMEVAVPSPLTGAMSTSTGYPVSAVPVSGGGPGYPVSGGPGHPVSSGPGYPVSGVPGAPVSAYPAPVPVSPAMPGVASRPGPGRGRRRRALWIIPLVLVLMCGAGSAVGVAIWRAQHRADNSPRNPFDFTASADTIRFVDGWLVDTFDVCRPLLASASDRWTERTQCDADMIGHDVSRRVEFYRFPDRLGADEFIRQTETTNKITWSGSPPVAPYRRPNPVKYGEWQGTEGSKVTRSIIWTDDTGRMVGVLTFYSVKVDDSLFAWPYIRTAWSGGG